MSGAEKIFLVRVGKGVEAISRVFDKPTIVLGRAPDVDFMIPDLGVSRNHLELILKHNQMWIVDLGSANGTFLNGQQVEKNKKHLCASGDFIELGSNRIPIWVETVDKGFDFNDLKSARLPGEDKQKLMQIVQSAYLEAKRIQDQTIEFLEKHKKNTEQKNQETILAANQKAEEIISLANHDASLIKEDAKKRHAEIVLSAQKDAELAVKHIYEKAQLTKQQSEIDANERINKSHEQAKQIKLKAEEDIQNILAAAKAQAEQIRKTSEELAFELKKQIQVEKNLIISNAEKDAEAIKVAANEYKESLLRQFEEDKNDWQNAAETRFAQKVEEKENELEAKRLSIIKQLEQEYKKKQDEAELIVKVKIQAAENEAIKKREQADLFLNQAKAELEEKRIKIAESAQKEAEAVITTAKNSAESIISEAKQVEQSIRHEIEKTQQALSELGIRYDKAKNETVTVIAEYEKNLTLLRSAEQQLGQIKNQVEKYNNEEIRLKDSINNRNESYKQLEADIAKATQDVQDLLAQKKNIVIELDKLRSQIVKEKEDADSEIQRLRTKAKAEIEEYKKRENDLLNRFKLDELQAINSLQAELKMRLTQERSRFAQLVAQHVEDHFVVSVKPLMKDGVSLSEFMQNLKADIQSTLEEEIFKATDGAAQVAKPEIIQQQKKKMIYLRNTSVGLTLTLVGLFYFSPSFKQVVLNIFKENSVEVASKNFSDELEKERSRRYQPEQKEEWHESYTDAVLFSKYYTELKLNNEKQEKWIKELHNYLFTQLKVNEDDIVKIVSKEAALVAELNEIKSNTHPDFVKENIKKMRDLEVETVAELKRLIGSEEKYRTFLNYSKTYYLNELNTNRLPANK